MKKTCLVINAPAEGYSPDQVVHTMSVSDLIYVLQQFPDDMPVYIGNDWKSEEFGWYTYGSVCDIDEWEYESDDDEDYEDEDLLYELAKENRELFGDDCE